MATVLAQAATSGKDVLVLHESGSLFLSPYDRPIQEVKVQNGSVLCAFDEELAEIYPCEKAKDDVDVLFVAVDSYPCQIEIRGETLEVRKDDCKFEPEEGEE